MASERGWRGKGWGRKSDDGRMQGGALLGRKRRIKRETKAETNSQSNISSKHVRVCVFCVCGSALVCVSLVLSCSFYSPRHRSVPVCSFFLFHFPSFSQRTTHLIHRGIDAHLTHMKAFRRAHRHSHRCCWSSWYSGVGDFLLYREERIFSFEMPDL